MMTSPPFLTFSYTFQVRGKGMQNGTPRSVSLSAVPPSLSAKDSSLPRSHSGSGMIDAKENGSPINGRAMNGATGSTLSVSQTMPRLSGSSSTPGSLRASTSSAVSGATSNSSAYPSPVPPSAPFASRATSYSHSQAEEVDQTAFLIQRLYERLEAQGVPGDGWEEGRERSRDGIICQEEAEGWATFNRGGQLRRERTVTQRPDEGGQLNLKEEQILKRVDRYGFFSLSHPAALGSQHHRHSSLPQLPLLALPGSRKRLKPPPPPPTRQQKLAHRASVASLMSSSTPEDLSLETKRVSKWGEMLLVASRQGGNAKEWEVARSWWDGRGTVGRGKYRQLQRRVFKGVPDRWRRAVWGLMMEKMAEETKGKGRSSSLDQLEQEFKTLVEAPSSQDVQIDLDVPRTISGHVMFHTRYGHGQRALFRVLHAFGLHCTDIGGYCQGMGPIAATFLCYFEPERAFACLVRLFEQYGLKDVFAPGFPGLLQEFYVQERLVELLMPSVHTSFQTNIISTSAYATKWYITLFANTIPFATQLRLWDALLLEGIDVLVVAAVSIIWCYQEEFVTSNATFESILSRLSSYFTVEDDDALLRWIRKTLRQKGVREKMKEWRAEWQGFVRDGSASKRVT